MKRTNKLSKKHIHKLILFAEHLKKCKLKDYYMEDFCTDNKIPHFLTNAEVVFMTYPFIYLELPNVFPNE
jgi:hypothetical protein